MRLQLLLLSAVLLVNGKLTREENSKRLDMCGKGSGPWMWTLTDNRGDRLVAATPISPRHFFAYSMTLLMRNRKWIYSRESIDKKCQNENTIVEIPSEVLPILRLSPFDKLNDTSYKPPVVVKGYFVGLCSEYIKQMFSYAHAPMILEVKNDLGEVTLVQKNKKLKSAIQLKHGVYIRSISQVFPDVFTTAMFGAGQDIDRGGAIVQKFDDRWIMTGTSGAVIELLIDPNQRMFIKLSMHLDDICQVSGVCDPSMPFPEPDPVIEKKNGQSSTAGGKGEKSEKKEEEEPDNKAPSLGIESILVIALAYLF
uniref:Uncharacterized protein n=1 Tax=Caenorhabditis tropicalis TaxID=1561998 RepID=A0A1I7UNZ8_9PELO